MRAAVLMAEKSTGRQRCPVYCGHCKQFVSKTTFYRHYGRYFNTLTEEWKEDDDESCSDCNSTVDNDGN